MRLAGYNRFNFFGTLSTKHHFRFVAPKASTLFSPIPTLFGILPVDSLRPTVLCSAFPLTPGPGASLAVANNNLGLTDTHQRYWLRGAAFRRQREPNVARKWRRCWEIRRRD